MILEYAVGAATVSISWSEYFNKLCGGRIPYEWCHSPFQKAIVDGTMHHGIINAPSLLVLLVISLLLIRGTQESAIVNTVIVIIKVAIVVVFIIIGWHFIQPANHTPYLIPANQPPASQPDGTFI